MSTVLENVILRACTGNELEKSQALNYLEEYKEKNWKDCLALAMGDGSGFELRVPTD